MQNKAPKKKKPIRADYKNGDANIILDELLRKRRKFQLIISSPPYSMDREYEKNSSFEEYKQQIELVIEKLVRLLSTNGSLCWQVGNYIDKKTKELLPLDIFFYEIFKRYGLILRNRIVWHFEHGFHASKRFSGRYETILWFTKSDKYIFNLDDVRVPAKYPGKTHYKGEKKGQFSGNPRGKILPIYG